MPALDTIKEFLEKARKRLSDENPDYADMDEEQDPEGLNSEVSEDSETDDADKWLKDNGGSDASAEEEEKASEPEYSEYGLDEDHEAHIVEAQKPVQKQPIAKPAPSQQTESTDDLQPSREELANMREYTRPWDRNARDRAKLEAEPDKNPVKHHQGRLIEARNTSHADRQKAQESHQNSSEYQNADPITQMEMDSKFHDDWHKQNPEHLINALNTHQDAHKKGSQALSTYNQIKDDKIRHIAGGGAQPGSMSVEEGMQHVGGDRDEDSSPTGIQQDKGAAFASGNQEFLQNYMKNYDKKNKKFSNVSDMDTLDSDTRKDVNSVLGEHPALKDPTKKRQVDRFVERYHPQIGKAARHVLSKLGLTDKVKRGEIDPGLLHEAGVHALFQAVNDYDHDHPSKAKFTTHLTRKMHGLMQTALKTQDEIPGGMRAGARKFDQQRRNENAAPVKHTNKEGVTTIIQPGASSRPAAEIATAHHSDVQDRLKRVAASRAPMVRKQTALQPKPAAGPKMNINHVSDEGGEE